MRGKNIVFKTAVPASARGGKAELLHLLRERVKELTAIHGTARILQKDDHSIPKVLKKVLLYLPPAWQYPEITSARIKFDGFECVTRNFSVSPWCQKATFRTSDGKKGELEVRYHKKMPPAFEGPFLAEERSLINSLAEMLASYMERENARQALVAAKDELEDRVARRTVDLEKLNRALRAEIEERKNKERKIRAYQRELKSMTAELAVSEELERRNLASELHEQIGHTLALIKMRLAASNGGAPDLSELVDRAIKVTRDLTFELGSPVLYELGLTAAVESLAEQFSEKYGIKTFVSYFYNPDTVLIAEEIKLLLFKAVRELLHNAAKHSGAREVVIVLRIAKGRIMITVSDNGKGFSLSGRKVSTDAGFGLFSIKERLGRFGGTITIKSSAKKGAAVTLVSPVTLKRGKKWK
ncbi:MAG: ATP-binding protein [Elusimicrobiaceae bacterium]